MSGDAKEMMISLMSSVMPGRGGEDGSKLASISFKILPDGHEELMRRAAIEAVSMTDLRKSWRHPLTR
jgi:hypothetical protein